MRRKPNLKKLNKVITDSKFDSDSFLLQNIDVMTEDYCRIKLIELLRNPQESSSKTLIQLIAMRDYLHEQARSKATS